MTLDQAYELATINAERDYSLPALADQLQAVADPTDGEAKRAIILARFLDRTMPESRAADEQAIRLARMLEDYE